VSQLSQAGIVTMTNEQFNEKEQWRREVMLACEPHMWHNWNTFLRAAQKVRPARPQPMKAPEA
jgi:hypothetical protein